METKKECIYEKKYIEREIVSERERERKSVQEIK